MKKRKGGAVVGLVVLLAILVGLLYLAVYGVNENHSGSARDIHLGLDLAGGVSITYQAVGDENPTDEAMNDTVYKLQQRVEQYSTEAQVYREGSNRINIEIPGVSDANQILEELGRPGSLYFIRQTDDNGNLNYNLSYETFNYEIVEGKTIDSMKESGDIVLEGTDVAAAQAGYQKDSMNNQQIVVDLTFTDAGREKFAAATQRAFEKGETIGIY